MGKKRHRNADDDQQLEYEGASPKKKHKKHKERPPEDQPDTEILPKKKKKKKKNKEKHGDKHTDEDVEETLPAIPEAETPEHAEPMKVKKKKKKKKHPEQDTEEPDLGTSHGRHNMQPEDHPEIQDDTSQAHVENQSVSGVDRTSQSTEKAEDDDQQENNSSVYDPSGWTESNVQRLVRRVGKHLADLKDREKDQGINEVPWDQVQFDPFSEDQCQAKFKSLWQKVRKTRTVDEIFNDLSKQVSDGTLHIRFDKPHSDEKGAKTNNHKLVQPRVLFIRQRVASALEKNPEGSTTDLRKQYQQKWNNLKRKKKLKFIKASLQHNRELLEGEGRSSADALELSLQVLNKAELRMYDKSQGIPEKPAKQGQNLFMKEHMEGTKASLREVMAQYSRLSAEEKAAYSLKANQERASFKEDLETYLNSLPEELRDAEKSRIETQYKMLPSKQAQQAKEKLKVKMEKNTRKKTDLFPDCPKKPPNSYAIFVKEKLKELGAGPEAMARCSQLWKQMSEQRKESYRKKYKDDMVQYEKDVIAYAKKLSPENRAKLVRANKLSQALLSIVMLQAKKENGVSSNKPSSSSEVSSTSMEKSPTKHDGKSPTKTPGESPTKHTGKSPTKHKEKPPNTGTEVQEADSDGSISSGF